MQCKVVLLFKYMDIIIALSSHLDVSINIVSRVPRQASQGRERVGLHWECLALQFNNSHVDLYGIQDFGELG